LPFADMCIRITPIITLWFALTGKSFCVNQELGPSYTSSGPFYSKPQYIAVQA